MFCCSPVQERGEHRLCWSDPGSGQARVLQLRLPPPGGGQGGAGRTEPHQQQ